MAHSYGFDPVREMVTDTTSNTSGCDEEKQFQRLESQAYSRLPQTYPSLQFVRSLDVRMKRHPELQPYVPYDRDRCSSGNRRPNSNTNCSSNYAGNFKPNVNRKNFNTPNSTGGGSTPIEQKPKKCVSMTRLDQLSQPKRIFTKVAQKSNHSTSSTNTKPSSSATATKIMHPKVTSSSAPPKSAPTQKLQSSSAPARKSVIRPSRDQEQFAKQVPIKITPMPESNPIIPTPLSSALSSPSTSPSNTPSNTPSITTSTAPSTTISNSVSTETSTNPSATASMTASLSNGRLKDEEEFRLKAEEELKEVARRQEEERQSRQLKLDSILSKFNISP